MQDIPVDPRHRAVRDVVQVLVHLQDARQRDDLTVVTEVRVRHRAAGREAARDRHEVTRTERTSRVGVQRPQDVRDGHPAHRVVIRVPPAVGHGLEHHAADGRVAQSEFDDGPGLVLVDIALDGRHEDDVEIGLGQTVQRSQLRGQERLATDDLVGLVRQPIELEVDQWPERGEPLKPIRIVRDPEAVGVDHHVADVALLRRRDHLQ